MRAWLMALAVVAVCLPAQAQVSDGKENLRIVQHGTLTIRHGTKQYRGRAVIRLTPRVKAAKRISLDGVVAPLAAKARQIVSTCGSRVISAMRRTLIAGTRTISLHASGRAVDLAGNPTCIYAMLRDWPGGYTTDYARMRHVHISYSAGGREWGRRFVHYSARRKGKKRHVVSVR